MRKDGAQGDRIVLVGECMIARPWSRMSAPRFDGVVELMRSGATTYAHLETVIGRTDEVDGAKSSDWLGSYLIGEPRMAGELAWAGVDIVSAASNHSFDFGQGGIRSTLKHCGDAGLACAGIGMDLEAARAPVYTDGPAGRIALVSLSSGNKAYEIAGLGKSGIPARAGINPLRVKTLHVVPTEAAKSLREVGRQLNILREGGKPGPANAGLDPGEFRFGLPADQSTRSQNAFIEGDGFDTRNLCHPADLEANLRVISEARDGADIVLVAHHFNISDGIRGDAPPNFVRDFARVAIDAGADIFIGHGWHKTMGIEVYKGRPIIYGIGNFVAHSEFMSNVPYDSYEAWGHPVDRLTTLGPNLHPLHPGLDGPSETWWSSAIIEVMLENGCPAGLRLTPVELGRDVGPDAKLRRASGAGNYTDGRPLIADGDNARAVLERLARLSRPLGTELQIEGNVGWVRC